MRILVRALLPLGEGVLLDTFMGSGSTIAAADAVGYQSVGIEIDAQCFALADKTPHVLPSTKPRRAAQPLSYKKPAAAA